VWDLDCCVEKGELSDEAREIVQKLNSYTELSISGTGVHVWTLACVPRNRNLNSVEVYTTKRFMMVTGRHLPDSPRTIEPRQAEVDEIYLQIFDKHGNPARDPDKPMTEGERHNTLCSEAGRMVSAGVRGKTLQKALEALNEERCDPPLPEDELEGIFQWADGLPKAIFDEKKQEALTAVLAKYLCERGNLRRGEGGYLFRYVNGAYRNDGEEWVAEQVKAALGAKCRSYHIREVTKMLQAGPVEIRPEGCIHRGLINCANGFVDWQTGELRAHDPQVPSVNQLPVNWNPGAEAPATAAFLREVFKDDEDTVQLALEVTGYTLLGDNRFRKAILCYGGGANGKSTWLNALEALAGERNIATVPLQSFGDDRFAASDLYGKSANVCGDLDTRGIARTDIFKQLTGGDLVRGDRKFQPAWSFRWRGVMLFSANTFPVSGDPSAAWWDRWIVLPFERRFVGKRADPFKIERLTNADELEGHLLLAVEALRGLMARGRFTNSLPARRALREYRCIADSVTAFLLEECLLAKNDEEAAWFSISRTKLYNAYRRMCESERRPPVSARTFYQRVRQVAARELGGRVAQRKVHGERRFRGLTLKTDKRVQSLRFVQKHKKLGKAGPKGASTGRRGPLGGGFSGEVAPRK